MAETMAPAFVTPQRGVQVPPVVSIVGTGKPLSEGIQLHHNRDKYGFFLGKEIEGFGLAPFENTTQPRASGGAVLRHRRTAEGSMFLPLTLVSPNPASMYDMMAWLVDTVTGQDGYFDVVYFDPYSQEARRRTVLYDSGLETVNEVIPDFKHVVGITGTILDPFWRGPERVVTERIAPPVKPLITADPGSPVNRWDDPEFSDTVAYEPWFVVDGGLEKNGTGSDHGVFASGHRISVNPGETVSVSAGVSFVDGPNVGDIQVRVRAYDVDGELIAGSESTVISESYGGTYTGTYNVPGTGVEIELGFYTGADVHANTRVRIDNLDVKRDVQYLARYEWEGEPHASPSIKRDHTGQIVARNLVINGDFEHGLAGWVRYAGTLQITTDKPELWGDIGGTKAYHVTDGGAWFDGFLHRPITVSPSQWVGIRSLAACDDGNTTSYNFVWRDGTGSQVGSVTSARYDAYVPGGAVMVAAFQAPESAASVEVRILQRQASGLLVAGSRMWADRVSVSLADSEQAALDQVAEYFDGDTPDVVDEGSREGAFSYPFFPVFLADSTVQGEHELRVEGDAPVWPVWEIVGPGRDVEIIGPSGGRLFVEGEVSARSALG